MAQIKWYFEDFEPGRVIEVGSRTLNEEEILAVTGLPAAPPLDTAMLQPGVGAADDRVAG